MKTMSQFPRAALDPDLPTGLLLCGMGGPDGPAAVEPFLRNLFRDPAIFPLPRLVAPMAGRIIARRRTAAAVRRYRLLNPAGATPQLQQTRDQATRLARLLAQKLGSESRIIPAVAMRYWHPFPDEAVIRLLAGGVGQFIVVTTYPQFSPATAGSTLDFVLAALARLAPDAPVFTLADWHQLDGYIHDLADPVIQQLRQWAATGTDPRTCALIYAAHSLPEAFIRRGDPFQVLTRATAAAVHGQVTGTLTAMGHGEWLDSVPEAREIPLAYQSRVGPIRWLQPELNAEVRRLAAAGCRRLMVQPVSFVGENIETLVELDLELAAIARDAGITGFHRGRTLNLKTGWLESLAALLAARSFAREANTHA